MSQDSTELSQRFRQQIDDHKIEVPMLPEVARKVMMLVNDEDSDAAQLSAVIQGDQTLAAHIIRIANSPIYTPAGNIVSLQQAISRLGMKLIAEVAMAASLNLTIIAEGVETEEQKALLTQEGCDLLQGYLYGRPVPPEEFLPLFIDKDVSEAS